jgi:MFS family permease
VSQLEERYGAGADRSDAPGPPPTLADLAHPAPSPDGWRASTFAALGVKPYRLLWLGGVFSFLAVQMQMIARGWLAYDLTGSNSILGAVMFGFGLPMLLLTPWGGVAADRFGKRRIILMAQWLLILSGLLVAVAIVFDVLTVALLILSAVFQGAAFSFLGPARMAFTGELVGRRLLPNAIVLQQMSMNGTRVFGPSLAGLLIAVYWFGPAGVYFLTSGFTLLASFLTMRLPEGGPSPERVPDKVTREFTDGLRYVKHNPHLLLLLLVSLTVVMTAFPYVAFLPTLADDIYGMGSSGYGFMSGVSAVGAVVASLFVAGRSGGPNAWKIQAFAGFLFGFGLALLWISPNIWTALAILLFVGAANSAFQAVNNSLVLMGSESHYHGRVQSLMMLSFSGFGLVALPLGILADAIGLQNLLGLMGAVTMTVMVTYFIVRPIIERRHPTPVFAD